MTGSLRYITESPPNASTPLGHLDGAPLSPELVYLRNNFDPPAEVPDELTFARGDGSTTLHLDEILAMRASAVEMVLECAGNGRRYMDPVPDGTPWDLGGASPVVFAGPSLLDVLGPVDEDVTELVFTGADRGFVGDDGEISYQFSLGRHLWSRSILATRLGDEPLGHSHGGPIRLVVPGEYAMKSVKWLTRIEESRHPFTGHFVSKYRYFSDTGGEPEGSPVAAMSVRSVIARPLEGSSLPNGRFTVSGSAWSGRGAVSRVEISVDHGPWAQVNDLRTNGQYGAAAWSSPLDLPEGGHRVSVRATDDAGNTQPPEPRWNGNGYANNLIHSVAFQVVRA